MAYFLPLHNFFLFCTVPSWAIKQEAKVLSSLSFMHRFSPFSFGKNMVVTVGWGGERDKQLPKDVTMEQGYTQHSFLYYRK